MLLEKPEAVRSAPRRRSDNVLPSALLSQTELLAIFDPNRERAEDKYLDLYHKLVRYFAWNRKFEPEDLAQEALKRGLNRLQQGQKITVQNPESYFFGVARNLLRESWNTQANEPLEDHVPAPVLPLFRNLNREEQAVFLTECLRNLPENELEMLMAYTQGEGEAWARKAGLQPTTLRSRIHRIRKRLENLALAKGAA